MLRPYDLLLLAAILAASAPLQAQTGTYRGMPAGWPYTSNGYYAAYQPYGAVQPATVARPVIPVVPVTAAYANPAYFGAYSAGYRGAQGYPAAAVNYSAPTAAYYAPQTGAAYYAPTAVRYAPQQSYAVSPAGSVYSGSEAATVYGQPANINYVPPRVTYRPAYAAVPVYAYRPVTVYQPATGQAVTCLQPAAPATTCQPTATRCGGSWCSWLNPFNHRWFKHNWFGHGGCGSAPTTSYCGQYAAPTTAYCGQAAAPTVAACGATTGCGQPYYPAPTNVIPVVPTQPATVIPATPTIRSPIIGTPTVPPPPTRVLPGTTITPGATIAPGGSISPADTRPSLTPGSGTIITPGTGSFPTTPSTTTPGSSFGTPGSSFGTPSGTNYAPATDPYASGTGSFSTNGASASRPGRASAKKPAPIAEPRLSPGVEVVPDPDAQAPKTDNRAPQLIDPRDKMARQLPRGKWGVVPAVWPVPSRVATSAPSGVAGGAVVERTVIPVSRFEPTPPAEHDQAAYDDGGWRSGR